MKKPSTEFEKQVLQIASLGVWQIVTGGKMKAKLDQIADSRWAQKTGLFVTLRKKNEVRGSIGLLESTTNLDETLFDAAQTAATHDQRYPPIKEEELDDIDLQVTLLSLVQKLNSPKDIIIGEVGLIVTRGEKQAVLLPYVASENHWSPEQFLEATCEKAQLSHSAWKDPNTLVEYFTSLTLDGGKLINNIKEYI